MVTLSWSAGRVFSSVAVLQYREFMLSLTQTGSTNMNTTNLAAMAEFVSQKSIMAKHTEAELCDTCVAGLNRCEKRANLR